jgi:hypothetical protein
MAGWNIFFLRIATKQPIQTLISKDSRLDLYSKWADAFKRVFSIAACG